MLLGDSLTERSAAPFGLSQLLSDAYIRKLDVVTRGFSGYNTQWILPVFEKVLAKRNERQNLAKIQLLTIWLGANDATLPGEAQHVPLEAFKENLSKLIRMVKDPTSEWYSPETRIIVLTPPPINTAGWAEFLRVYGNPPRDTTDRVFDGPKTYALAAKDVAQQEGVVVVDTWTLLWEAAGEKEENLMKFLCDGLHLSSEGYKLVYDALIETILRHYPEIHFDKPFMAYPAWTDLNGANYMEKLKDSSVRKAETKQS
ncbi:SGNH hydrolase [Phanerochaete sordida]|uniref:SGNH hydrolase n=1 Tax=Phanerochaete sordida TaxID=48140 RepID=A0A9P3LK43_9APHY|nr:SGNH hydrolase [Phanerochaete sordida]